MEPYSRCNCSSMSFRDFKAPAARVAGCAVLGHGRALAVWDGVRGVPGSVRLFCIFRLSHIWSPGGTRCAGTSVDNSTTAPCRAVFFRLSGWRAATRSHPAMPGVSFFSPVCAGAAWSHLAVWGFLSFSVIAQRCCSACLGFWLWPFCCHPLLGEARPPRGCHAASAFPEQFHGQHAPGLFKHADPMPHCDFACRI